jgi:hypothetical protein
MRRIDESFGGPGWKKGGTRNRCSIASCPVCPTHPFCRVPVHPTPGNHRHRHRVTAAPAAARARARCAASPPRRAGLGDALGGDGETGRGQVEVAQCHGLTRSASTLYRRRYAPAAWLRPALPAHQDAAATHRRRVAALPRPVVIDHLDRRRAALQIAPSIPGRLCCFAFEKSDDGLLVRSLGG